MRYFIYFFSLLSIHFSFSQVVWTNPITGTNPASSNPYTAGQTISANIIVSGIGRGSGIGKQDAANVYRADGWSEVGLNTSDYFYFTLTPDPGYWINLSNFTYTATNGLGGGAQFAFRSSLDNYASNIGSAIGTGTTIALGGVDYTHVTTPITFRFYGYQGNGGNFSIDDFTFNGSVALPIQLDIFEVRNQLKPVLYWSTLSELNNDYFTVLRSKNGQDFQEIVRMKGNGTSDKLNEYSYIDQSPLTGKVYYRLKQTDFNGQFTYSTIKSIIISTGTNLPIVYPSIMDDKFNIDFSNVVQKKWTWSLLSLQGQVMKKGVIEETQDIIEINFGYAPTGILLLNISSKDENHIYRLVKK
ncbi:MAG: hypothetical protein ABI844_12320 [Saprospiraceae bacterium]